MSCFTTVTHCFLSTLIFSHTTKSDEVFFRVSCSLFFLGSQNKGVVDKTANRLT